MSSHRARALRISLIHGLGRAEWGALGTRVTVLTAEPGRAASAAVAVRAELVEVDAACSRFRPDSELQMVNHANGRPVVISHRLAEAVEVALRAARETDGDIDPTVGASLGAIGHDRDFADVARSDTAGHERSSHSSISFVKVRGWRELRFDRRRLTLQVPRGIEIDLGVTAKSLAADRAAERAAVAAGCGVLVSLGGDIAVAGEAPEAGWSIKIADWHGAEPAAPGPVVNIVSGGLATSSTTVRRWQRQGQSMHHIVTPRTGRPAEVCWRTVSVAAATCVDANTASTASVIRGAGAPGWLESLGLAARLVRPDGSITLTSGWPAERRAA